jgi:hypothetical protein
MFCIYKDITFFLMAQVFLEGLFSQSFSEKKIRETGDDSDDDS